MTYVNFGSVKKFKLLFWGWIAICDLYLFHFMVLLNLNFNFSKKFVLFSFDKVTTETCNFVSVILKLNYNGRWFAGVISAKTQFLGQVKINSTSQLFIWIFKLLQKLLKFFSGITT